MDEQEILNRFEAEFEDVVKDPAARRFAAEQVDQRVTSGEGKYDQYHTYRQAGNSARAYLERQREGKKASHIVAEMKRARGQL